MIDPQIRVGIDVGCKAHRVGIANRDGKILEEFDISHTDAGFQDFFRRIERHKEELAVPVAVAMEGFNGYARPLDRMIQEHGYVEKVQILKCNISKVPQYPRFRRASVGSKLVQLRCAQRSPMSDSQEHSMPVDGILRRTLHERVYNGL